MGHALTKSNYTGLKQRANEEHARSLMNFMKSFFLTAEQYTIVEMHHIFCIHSFVEGNHGSFKLLAIINKAVMNKVELVSWMYVAASLGYMTRMV